MDKINFNKATLRKFGITMGVAFLLITVFIFFRHKYSIIFTGYFTCAFFICAFLAPGLLKPVYFLWMKLAFVLSWVNTRLILCVIFYLVFTPIGLAMKLFGKDHLERKIDKTSTSYWKKKEIYQGDLVRYERQF